MGDPSGFVKLIADGKYGELIGGHLIGHDVSELLPELTLAQKWDLTAGELAQNVSHPPDDVRSTAGVLPRPHRPHDQLLRAIWVAAIGGLVVGHILWLAGISIAIATRSVSSWVLAVRLGHRSVPGPPLPGHLRDDGHRGVVAGEQLREFYGLEVAE